MNKIIILALVAAIPALILIGASPGFHGSQNPQIPLFVASWEAKPGAVKGNRTLTSRSLQAQNEQQLALRLSRDIGFSSGSGQIQGTFTMKASGPDNLVRVVFSIDGQSIGEASQAPFQLRFNTGSFSLGVHTLSAVGYTSDGQELHSNEIRSEFVTSEAGFRSAMRIIVPVFVLVFAAVLLSAGAMMLSGRGKTQNLPPGTPRNYGAFGGTICPKCGRPFSLHFLAVNLGLRRLDRCPYCGKWSLVRAKPLQNLREAEAAELAQAGSAEPGLLSDEERLKRDLESSRYDDL
jgi:DNA-directed RNA polymerase subunit RPC12/RpoP